MTTPTLDARREQAARDWRALEANESPIVYVGAASCGRAAGALEVVETVRAELEARATGGRVVEVGCIGPCYLEPLMDVKLPGRPRVSWSNVTAKRAGEILSVVLAGEGLPDEGLLGHFGSRDELPGVPRFFEHPMLAPQVRIVLRNCGIINPEDADHYLARQGYEAIEKAFAMGPELVLEEVKASGIRGRGGAGFPTAVKWGFCRNTPADQRYMICNADEGDPGAFMNRSLLEGDPHAVLEGLLIASYTLGASEAFIYIRAEYPLAIERLRKAISRMRELGLVGRDILGSGFDLEIKIKEGAGAFVCGEETALIASIEGRRGMPRTRPPFPASSGLWGKPTIINNVETLGTLASIVRNGAEWYTRYGTETSKGTKTFSLVGKVARPGLIEVPMGTPLRKIIYDIGGGVADGKRLKAVQTGGPSGGCIPAEHLDLDVDYENLKQTGAIMGSGGMIVVDEDVCAVDLAHYFLSFTQMESCGKCVPCRIGTRQMKELLERIKRGEGTLEDIGKLESLAQTILSTSLCGLGQTAPNPVLTTLRYFRDEYEQHVSGYCPSNVCKRISPAPCQRTCPIGMDVPSYVALIAGERFEEALEVMHVDNPFPAVCGRICPRPCESNCTRAESDQPVAIRALKRFVTDQVMRSAPPPIPEVRVTRSERVAVVGAGPCGLTAAHDLALGGYGVTVFEAAPEAGGMLRRAVPSFRMHPEVIQWEVARVAGMVEIQTGKALGEDFSLSGLLDDGYDAVLLAVGAPRGMPFKLGGNGSGSEAIDAMTFLEQAKQGSARRPGSNVVVIGWSHLAMDAARTAIRLGSANVSLLYPRTRDEIPFSGDELAQAEAEGVVLRCGVMPAELLKDDGRLAGVRCVETRPAARDRAGRQRPASVSGSDHVVPCDAVIAAIGHQPEPGWPSQGVRAGILNNILVDTLSMETSLEGVFAAGDAVSAGATVIEAIASGQRAAAAIHRSLAREEPKAHFKLAKPRRRVAQCEVEEELRDFQRPPEPLLPLEERRAAFDEAVCSFSAEEAVKEAKRCLRCDLD